MSDDGYTLAEMLTALTILGLALGGLGVVTSLVSRQQWTAKRLHAQLVQDRSADQSLGRWLGGLDAAGLQGDGRSLSAPCGARICRARLESGGRQALLVLEDPAGAVRRLSLGQRVLRFSYIYVGGSVSTWPPSSGEDGSPLRAVRLAKADAGSPVAVARAWTLEPRDCQFDAVVGACRTLTP